MFGNGYFISPLPPAGSPGSGIAIDNTNPPITDISWNNNAIRDLTNTNLLTITNGNALNAETALSNFVYLSPAVTVDGKQTNVGHEQVIASTPLVHSYNNFICIGIYIQPVLITGVGILNPVFNLGNDIGVFNNILNVYTPVFISFGNEQLLKPAPLLVSGTSWIGKDIKIRITTAATGYTDFQFSIRLALICIP